MLLESQGKKLLESHSSTRELSEIAKVLFIITRELIILKFFYQIQCLYNDSELDLVKSAILSSRTLNITHQNYIKNFEDKTIKRIHTEWEV